MVFQKRERERKRESVYGVIFAHTIMSVVKDLQIYSLKPSHVFFFKEITVTILNYLYFENSHRQLGKRE